MTVESFGGVLAHLAFSASSVSNGCRVLKYCGTASVGEPHGMMCIPFSHMSCRSSSLASGASSEPLTPDGRKDGII